MLDQALTQLTQGKSLSRLTTQKLFIAIFKGELSEAQIKTVLLLLAKKGETIDEIIGCLQAIEKLEPKIPCSVRGLIDTCGTGGDGSQLINVSTLSAFVIAGAGGKVAKHGNRSISSKCGSSDLMKALGVRLDAGPKKMIRSIQKFGIGYFHAPFYHPVFSRVQPIRQALKVRTIFNFLGPMVNPLKLDYQLVGVANKKVLDIYRQILKAKKIKTAWVCHSRDGLDEISTRAITDIQAIKKTATQKKTLNPKSLGFKKPSAAALRGGNAKQNKELALKILKGKLRGPLADIIIINAAAGLHVCGIAKNLKQGVTLAQQSLESRKAYEALQGLIKVTNG